jgi:saccharopine dehydrogenase-like NADP-dependent oxidoreductase
MAADLSRPDEVARLAASADLVVGAVPGAIGFASARAVLEAGRPLVDISFFPEDAFVLDEPARAAGVPALVDCGVAPGLSNLVLGRMEAELDRVHAFRCLVGGLPLERLWPWEYRAPFSPADVLEEYTRPARLRRGGREVVLPALSEVEPVDIPGLGTLEAFNTDGLRTLLRTSAVPDLAEKTLRYPGHAHLMRALRDAGFLDLRPRAVDGVEIAPRALTEHLLFDAWRLEEGEPELTVMRIDVEGEDGDGPVRHSFTLLDRTDPVTGTSSMARTTGYTCTAMVALVASGAWRAPGVAPPETLGARVELYQAVLTHLAERGIALAHETRRL